MKKLLLVQPLYVIILFARKFIICCMFNIHIECNESRWVSSQRTKISMEQSIIIQCIIVQHNKTSCLHRSLLRRHNLNESGQIFLVYANGVLLEYMRLENCSRVNFWVLTLFVFSAKLSRLGSVYVKRVMDFHTSSPQALRARTHRKG